MARLIRNGYLGDDYDLQYKGIQNEFSSFFSLSEDINAYCHELLSSIKIERTQRTDILLSSLFIKSLETYQSIHLLSQRGLAKEANILLRSLIEMSFYINRISVNDGDAIRYILKGEFERIRLIDTLIKKCDGWHNCLGGKESLQFDYSESKDSFNKLLKENNLKETDIKKFSPSFILKEANEKGTGDREIFQDLYVLYSYLCADVHSDSNSINDYLKKGISNGIESITYGQKINGIGHILGVSMHCMISVAGCIGEFFEAGNTQILYQYKVSLCALPRPQSV